MNSRYIRTQRVKLPRKRRSQILEGSFEDRGRWIRCWNCGAILDTQRVKPGDGSGITVQDFTFEEQNPRIEEPYMHPAHELFGETGLTQIITMETVNSAGAILKNGPDGNAITSYYTPRKSTASASSCWLCGTKNLP